MKLLCAALLSLALPALAQQPSGLGDMPEKVKKHKNAFTEEDKKKALALIRKIAAAKAAEDAKAAPKAPANDMRDAVGSTGLYYHFQGDQALKPDPQVSFLASFSATGRAYPMSWRDGVLYAGAQTYPIEGTTRLFVQERDAATIRRLLERRKIELRNKLARAPDWQAVIIRGQLESLARLRIVGLDMP